MPVKVFWGKDGPYALADTPAEAIELIRLGSNGLRKNGHQQAEIQNVAESRQLPLDKGEAVRRLSYDLNDRARAFLRALAGYKSEIEGEQFSEAIKEPVTIFGGSLGAICNAAKQNGMEVEARGW